MHPVIFHPITMFCQNAVIFSIQYIINSNLVISITVGICTTIIIRRPNTPLMDSILCQCLVCKQRQIMPFIRPTIGFIQYNRIFITHELGAVSPQFYGNRLRYVCFTPILFHTNRCKQFRLVSIQQCSTTVLDFNPTTIRYQACRTIAGRRTDNSTISSHNNFNHVCRVIPHGNDFMQLIRTARKFYPEITFFLDRIYGHSSTAVRPSLRPVRLNTILRHRDRQIRSGRWTGTEQTLSVIVGNQVHVFLMLNHIVLDRVQNLLQF